MTDFDKLIKEKAEQASYPYQDAAWKNFQKSAGLHRSSWKFWAAGAAVTVVAGVSCVLMMQRQNTASPEPAPVAVVQDTVASLSEDQMSVVFSESESSSPSMPAPSGKAKQEGKKSISSASEQNTPAAQQTETAAGKKTTVSRSRLGRTLVIDVDTIKENVPTDEELRNGNSRIF